MQTKNKTQKLLIPQNQKEGVCLVIKITFSQPTALAKRPSERGAGLVLPERSLLSRWSHALDLFFQEMQMAADLGEC